MRATIAEGRKPVMFYAIAFSIFCAVCTVLAFTRHPIYGLYFYMATTYVHPPSRWWASLLPDMRWALLSAVVTVLAIVFHRGKLSSRPLWLATGAAAILSVYALWMWIQTPWALDLEEHIDGSVLFVKYMLAFWFIYRVTDSKELIRNFLFTHALGCGLFGFLARFSDREAGRVEGVGGPGLDDANSLGMFLGTGAIVCLGLLLTQKGWRRWLALILLPAILEGFVAANSRGAFLGLIAGTVVVVFTMARSHRRVFWVVAVVAGLFAGIAADKMFVERMFTIGDVAAQGEEGDMSARSRTAIVEAQLHMARDYPMGVGHRGTVPLSPLYLERKWLVGGGADPNAGRSSHNTFLTTLVEQGVIGAIIFVTLVAWLFRAIVRVRRMDRRGVDPEISTLGGTMCAAIVVVLVAGAATDYLLAEIQFWMFAGLASLLALEASRRTTATTGEAHTSARGDLGKPATSP